MEGLSVVCRAGARLCALGVEHVVEIMRPLPVRALADTPPFVRGVSVIRGEPVPVVSLACLLGGDDARATRFISVKGAGRPAALAVDEVLAVRTLPDDSRRELSPLLGEAVPELVAVLGAIGDEPLLVLHSARIVPASVWAALGPERVDR